MYIDVTFIILGQFLLHSQVAIAKPIPSILKHWRKLLVFKFMEIIWQFSSVLAKHIELKMRTEIKMFFWVESFCFKTLKNTFLANKKNKIPIILTHYNIPPFKLIFLHSKSLFSATNCWNTNQGISLNPMFAKISFPHMITKMKFN